MYPQAYSCSRVNELDKFRRKLGLTTTLCLRFEVNKAAGAKKDPLAILRSLNITRHCGFASDPAASKHPVRSLSRKVSIKARQAMMQHMDCTEFNDAIRSGALRILSADEAERLVALVDFCTFPERVTILPMNFTILDYWSRAQYR